MLFRSSAFSPVDGRAWGGVSRTSWLLTRQPYIHSKKANISERQRQQRCVVQQAASGKTIPTQEEGSFSDAISRPRCLDASLSQGLSCNARKPDTPRDAPSPCRYPLHAPPQPHRTSRCTQPWPAIRPALTLFFCLGNYFLGFFTGLLHTSQLCK